MLLSRRLLLPCWFCCCRAGPVLRFTTGAVEDSEPEALPPLAPWHSRPVTGTSSAARLRLCSGSQASRALQDGAIGRDEGSSSEQVCAIERMMTRNGSGFRVTDKFKLLRALGGPGRKSKGGTRNPSRTHKERLGEEDPSSEAAAGGPPDGY